MKPRPVHILLAAILLLGAALRGAGLGHGLRHDPIADEAYFVDAAREVVTTGNPDHRFHEYPALPVYLLVPAAAALGPGPAQYLAARGVIVAFGLLSIGLAFLLGRRLAGEAAGLYAAAAMAVSTIDVRVAHEYRPDVYLGTAGLLALLAFTSNDAKRWALRCGAAVGLATAFKFSGALLGPAWALGLRWPRREAVRDAALGLIAAFVTFAVLSPYSLLNARDMAQGVATQATYHYRTDASPAAIAASYVLAWARSFGPGGLLLALGGGVLLMRGDDRRRHVPLVALPLLTLALFSTSPIRHERFLLIASGALATLAAVAVARFSGATRRLVAAAGLLPPLVVSVQIAAAYRQPSIEDDTAAWIEEHLAGGARVLSTMQTLSLDAQRFELRRQLPHFVTARAAVDWDVLVIFEDERRGWAEKLDVVARLTPRSGVTGEPVLILRAPEALRPRYAPLAPARVTASAGEAGALHDGHPSSAWSPGPQQTGEEWIEVAFDAPVRVGRITVDAADGPPRNLQVEVSDDGASFLPAPIDLGRLPSRDQAASRPRADVVLLDAPNTRAVRLRQVGKRDTPWRVAELHVDALLEAPRWARLEQRRVWR